MMRAVSQMRLEIRPQYTSGGAAYPNDAALYAYTHAETRFGEGYLLGRVNAEDGMLWLPRAMCPMGHEDRRSVGQPVDYRCEFTPRNDEQGVIAREGGKLLLAGRSFIVQAPTGWGKTVVGCAMAAAVKRRTLVITTKEDIMSQWADAAMKVLRVRKSEIGMWRGDTEPEPHHTFVVGLVQSVMKGPERYPDVDYESFGLVICDEVHRMGAEHFSQAMWWFPAKLRLGLSATPYRKDGREQVFFGHIGPIALRAEQETMLPRVVVRYSDWRVPRVHRGHQVVKLPHEAGKLGHITKMLGRHESRNRTIARFVLKALERQRNTIVFSDSLDHLARLKQLFRGYGVPEDSIGYYVGLSGTAYSGTKEERLKQRERAKAKPVILATYQMASEATDIPWLDACVLAIPRADVVQIVGRIRREYPDKKTPVVLDIIDDDSPVFQAFAYKRLRWYQSLGCEIRVKRH